MSVTISHKLEGDACTVVASGEIDVSNASELRRALNEALAAEAVRVEVDIKDVAYIDSTGIGVLVGAARRASEDGKALSVVRPQRNVARVLSLLGVESELGVSQ